MKFYGVTLNASQWAGLGRFGLSWLFSLISFTRFNRRHLGRNTEHFDYLRNL